MVLTVTLDTREYIFAATSGVMLNEDSRKRGLSIRVLGNNRRGIENDIDGAVGEFVAAKALNKFWHGPGSYKAHDIEPNIEVRTVPYNGGRQRLKIKKDDPDDSPFVLVLGTQDSLIWKIPGWILGKHGKIIGDWEDPTGNGADPAYFVDQGCLNSILTLR
jgi:hypothetical protein